MSSVTNSRIFVFYYKAGSVLTSDPLYQPLMAGNATLPERTKIPGDDTGDNISAKNKYYSELTGIYWVWKNTSQDITGSCHYRRYFTAQPEPIAYQAKRMLFYLAGLYKKRYGLIYTGRIDRFLPRILNYKEIGQIFSEYDAIFPVRRKFRYSVKEHYRRYHDVRDLDLLAGILDEKYPEYLAAFDQVLEGNRLYANNMFVLKKEHYGPFMNWWFDLLFEFENRINKTDYQGYQQRIMGFIAERLLTVWVEHQQLRIKELPVIYFKKLKKA
ncbi:MAG: DUF4422 domain-containing protein [Prolixibacteraceae bacterium]